MSELKNSVPGEIQTPVTPVTFAEAVKFWLKLGLISFGGPAGQIAIMHRELVEQRRWIAESRFLHALNYCMLLPGPEAQQLATYLGWLMHRTWGGIVAGALFILPSLVLLIGLTWLYLAYGTVTWVEGIFNGVKPAVVAIVAHAAHRIGSRTLKNPVLWCIAAASLAASFLLHIPFPFIVLCAALLGYLGGQRLPRYFQAQRHGANKHTTESTTLREQQTHIDQQSYLDQQTYRAAHTQFRWARLGGVLAVGAVLWALPMTLFFLILGWHHTFTQMAWFFTKAALLTFGGAYAVLPYVYQGAVNHYGWLAPGQMLDGLALGETTPGPLIMVVVFVAFVGGYTKTLFGPEANFWAGTAAALVVTWFTFLPSFIFIFAGAPFIESTHNRVAFTAPLTAITAAVVGVIVNLALFFAYHVFWPEGYSGAVNWSGVFIAAVAAFALFRTRIGIISVIVSSALAGLALHWLHVV